MVGNDNWRANNPEASNRIRRKANIKRRFGITVEEYEAYLAEACAICGEESQVLDHDHESGMPRAGLCHGCNKGIGCLGDDSVRTLKAARYLQHHALVLAA